MAEATMNIKQLKLQREQIKSTITKARNFYNTIDKDNVTLNIFNEVKLRLTKIELLLEQFNEVQFNIEIHADSPELDENERVSFERNYYSLCSDLETLLQTFSTTSNKISNPSHHGEDNSIILRSQVPTNNVNETSSEVNIPNNNLINQNTISSHLLLPKMVLPIFNGSFNNWVQFRDGFRSMVDSDPKIPNIQKMYLLKSYLAGSALELIQSLPVSEINYQAAWNILLDEYENSGLIISSHVKTILDIPKIIKESSKALKKLLNDLTNNLSALQLLGEPVNNWDTLLIPIMSDKFDLNTQREWELLCTKNSKRIQTITDLRAFIKTRCNFLEKVETKRLQYIPVKSDKFKSDRKNNNTYSVNASVNGNNNKGCFYCKKEHSIYKCDSFLKLLPSIRYNEAKKLNLCINCLKPYHSTKLCNASRCRKCGGWHNSLLHFDDNNSSQPISDESISITSSQSRNNNSPPLLPSNGKPQVSISNIATMHSVFLATAVVHIRDYQGQLVKCRVLLDNGSMSNFMTEDLCKRLNLKSKKVNYSITGVGRHLTHIQSIVNVQLSSCNSNFSITCQCLIIPKITEKLPLVSLNKNSITIPESISLADPDFHTSGEIDMLIGSTLFWKLLDTGKIQLNDSNLCLQETRLGWIISGSYKDPSIKNKSVTCCSVNYYQTPCGSENDIMKFWQIEEVGTIKHLSESEQFCETHFLNNSERNTDGRFVVKIPFKPNVNNLGESRAIALKRFYYIEQRLVNNPELYLDYSNFMNEYLKMGHMTEIIENNSQEELNYYLPHHAVIKQSSLTTKLRVVFDASMKTDSGLSLNDVQYVGPTVQCDLFSILLRFRSYNFVMTADISKMYRMVSICPSERKFQRIFWRDDATQPIRVFELNTITYGTASAPYLAIRCLHQLADENKYKYESASRAIKNSFYVDDFLGGANSEEELLQLQYQVTSILSSAGFELRQWLCNDKKLCEQFTINHNLESSILQLGQYESSKTLGVSWNAFSDTIEYSTSQFKLQDLPENNIPKTKRKILSETSQIFDPLGLLSPIIITAKILIQQLWLERISWDEDIPQHLLQVWFKFRNDLHNLTIIKIPRQVNTTQYYELELHGFGDASTKAYGACIYIRSKTADNHFSSQLLCSKSRVAPLKQVTLPRLELCSSLLLAQLVQRVCTSIDFRFSGIYLWSDSTITLSWIRGPPSKWKTFVANRVGEIQNLTDISNWHHVESKDNPADLISRGCSTTELRNSSLWWTGPEWLSDEHWKSKLNNFEYKNDDIPDQRIISNISITTDCEILTRFSSFNKLKRVIAYCLRFLYNTNITNESKFKGPLSTVELQNSLNTIIRLVQIDSFKDEYNCLINNKPLSKTSKLLQLNPFIETKDKLIRVGGRLQYSNLKYDKKHPPILPSNHFVTKLILSEEHDKLLHCGPTMLLSSLRERFWIIAGRNAAKGIVRKCVKCFRVSPSSYSYLMGNLPEPRVNAYTPFFNTGLDYAGPFLIKDRLSKRPNIVKAYICLFICLSTKAIHLEPVSDLTTNAFMATLKRFIGRRGKPLNLYSDNAKTFIGACAELNRLQKFLQVENETICNNLSRENISWHFIPARSPSFGGIWEAGIKSAKFHLKRVLGNARLSFEDFCTILVQIEAVLNSRPLCPLLSDPDNLNALTPSHFLIGRPLIAVPESNYETIPENRLKHYQRLQQILQHFWSRWKREYLSELQLRVKWRTNSQQLIKINTLVLVRDENLPPLQWPLGKIVELHPGKDNVVRVVSVKLGSSIVKRGVSRICALPFQ